MYLVAPMAHIFRLNAWLALPAVDVEMCGREYLDHRRDHDMLVMWRKFHSSFVFRNCDCLSESGYHISHIHSFTPFLDSYGFRFMIVSGWR